MRCSLAVWSLLLLAAGGERSRLALSIEKVRDPAPITSRAVVSAAAERAYPLGSYQFDSFVKDSYHLPRGVRTDEFYHWLTSAYTRYPTKVPGSTHPALQSSLEIRRVQLAQIGDSETRTAQEMELAAWTHRFLKTVLPHFTLDRGFELRNMARKGERQCFSQSVLIASLLQSAGLEAGVVMVSKNIHGREVNNAHAVVLLKLSDGADVLVDASEQTPFPRQRGLFGTSDGYRYVSPVYREGTALIVGYRRPSSEQVLDTRRFHPLGRRFLLSQFNYYRGERAVGGLFSGKPTWQGLQASAAALRISRRVCPENPQPVYLLGRVLLRQGKPREARSVLQDALTLYRRCGWVPPGPRDSMTLVRRASTP